MPVFRLIQYGKEAKYSFATGHSALKINSPGVFVNKIIGAAKEYSYRGYALFISAPVANTLMQAGKQAKLNDDAAVPEP